jgi:protein-S-isoprenylcysteine O-methyltransferase Ste14
MPAELFPTGRDPLRRLGALSLTAGLLGLLAIAYTMANFVRGRDGVGEWMLGVGFCLLFGAAAASLVQGVLLGHRARIEALEKRAAADADRPAAGTPS